MPLEDILAKIRADALSQREAILKDARSSAEELLKEARAKASEAESKIIREAVEEAERLKTGSIARIQSQRRQMVLQEKRRLLESLYARAADALKGMATDEYRELLLASISKAACGGEEVLLGSDDVDRLGAGFEDLVNKRVASCGKPGNLKVAYLPKSLGGGYILKRGGISVNVTFPALLGQLWDQLEIQAAQVLFGRE